MQLKSIQIKITLWVGFGLVLVGTGLIGASVFLSSNHKPEISSFVGKQAGLFLLLSGVALALVWSVSGGWLRSLIAATRFAEDLAQGLTPARLTTPARDEIGQLMQALNRLLEPANGLVPAEENQPATHESMPQLGAQVGLVTPGNLSGEIATNGAMNGTSEASLTMAELRGVISHVQERTEQLAKTSSATQNTTTSLVQEAELQADNVTQIVQAVAEMAQGIERVTENAALSASVAQQSWHTAKQGTEVVQSMLGGMSRLRAQVQQAARRLQYLGASSQEIGEIVQTLSDVSKRASYLALNAAIQAAEAGAAGHGFSVVAEEIERLAKRSAEATKSINHLLKTMQSGANEALCAMEESAREVVGGAQLVTQAGHSLQEIEVVSARLSELLASISQVSTGQRQNSLAVTSAMAQLSALTVRTTDNLKQSNACVQNLATVADELRSAVAAFKLPQNS